MLPVCLALVLVTAQQQGADSKQDYVEWLLKASERFRAEAEKQRTRERPHALLSGHAMAVNAVAFSPDGKLLASAGSDGTVRLWDVATAKQVAPPLRGHSAFVNCLAFSPDGTSLASGGADTTVRLWDVATAKERAILGGHTESVRCLAFAPDGRTLASASQDETVRLWNLDTLKERAALHASRLPQQVPLAVPPIVPPLPPQRAKVHVLAFSADGETVAGAGENTPLQFWDVRSGTAVADIRLDSDLEVLALSFTRGDNVSVVCAARSSELRQGRLAGVVSFWQVQAPAGPPRTQVGTYGGERALAVAVSPNERLVASVGHGGDVWLWEKPAGRELGPLPVDAETRCVAFSPDGSLLAVGSSDNLVRLWLVSKLLEQ